MTKWKRVTIVGVGLLGGSIGLALKEKGLAEEIIGYGRSNERLQLAKELGAVTETTLDLAEAVSQTELIVICSPVQMIAQQVKQIIPLCIEKVLITDVGSTKTTICQQLENHSSEFATFIGSHPLAGSEKSGVLHSQANLFEQKQVILTPHPNRQSNAQYQEQLTQLVNFWEALGANVSQMSPEDHDCLAAQISHLPSSDCLSISPNNQSRISPLGRQWLEKHHTYCLWRYRALETNYRRKSHSNFRTTQTIYRAAHYH